MPEEITDQEREELRNEKDVKKKKEMTFDEIMECPTWDCSGSPEVWSTGVRTPAGEIWCVGCPKCKGWVSQFLIPDTAEGCGGEAVGPYMIGIEIWEDMRKEAGR